MQSDSSSPGESAAQGYTGQGLVAMPVSPGARAEKGEARLRAALRPVTNHEHVFNNYLKLLAERPSWKGHLGPS